ncbi:ARID DNA-binding domain-containing protein [Endogone sp. FLAS-F59071]|nr:ARID DNA-binding domain-containing protein [Endogone sp. FLAS-F59071]|eukprot:RUS18585.1 ARID DNA-binding domain-containing protein [Endogone sp. FLAS-F59071]
MSQQPIDAIERTPEYEAFMETLWAFHKKHGTNMQAEPVLGGKKLDLLKIYKTVIAAGGYEKVSLVTNLESIVH